jgi:ribosomal protein S18 acetylase RimI-like enzyme
MLPPEMTLEPLRPDDYDASLELWNACEGVRANETREEFARILTRNPGLSSVIRRQDQLAAAVLCCHDGRRGYLYHLGVAAEFRQLGLGRALVEHCLAQLRAEGIRRCSIFLITSNESGEAFWKRIGWRERTDLKVLARDL